MDATQEVEGLEAPRVPNGTFRRYSKPAHWSRDVPAVQDCLNIDVTVPAYVTKELGFGCVAEWTIWEFQNGAAYGALSCNAIHETAIFICIWNV
jgi:hypothetical protein